jgi:hypothetical protein
MRQMLLHSKVVQKGNSAYSPELLRQVIQIGCDLQALRGSIEAHGGVSLPVELAGCLQRMDAVLQEVLPA